MGLSNAPDTSSEKSRTCSLLKVELEGLPTSSPSKMPPTTLFSSSCHCLNEKNPVLKPEDHPEAFIPLPPDGGWGWVVVFASFMNNFIIDGIGYAYGIIMLELMASFDTTKAKVSLIGSLLCGVYLASGPIAAAIVNKYNCRVTTFIGAVISTLAFLLSYCATSINMLLVTYGILGGIGFGLIYLPSIIIVNVYFERRRPLAVGIAVCGSGFGAFAFAPFVKFLLQVYDWSNCMLILAGLLLNTAVFGALMRPLKAPVEIQFEGQTEEVGKKRGICAQCFHRQKRESPVDRNVTLIVEDTESKTTKDVEVTHPLLDEMHDEVVRYATQLKEREKEQALAAATGIPLQAPEERRSSLTEGATSLEADGNSGPSRAQSTASVHIIRRHSDLRHQIGGAGDSSGGGGAAWVSSVPNLGASSIIGPCHKLVLRVPSVSNTTTAGGPTTPRLALPPSVAREDYLRPLYRKDIFYSGSIANLAPQHVVQQLQTQSVASNLNLQMIQGSYVMSLTQIPIEAPEEPSNSRPTCRRIFSKVIRDVLFEMTDITLLANPAFLLVCISALLTVGFLTPNFFLPDLAAHHNLPSESGALLLSFMGVTNMGGRLLFNWMATLSCCSALLINNVTLTLSGVITFFTPFLNTFPLLMVYAGSYGLLASASISLVSPILCNLLGVENLTNAFGLLSLARGISSSLGPPLAGAMFDLTGDPNAPFLLSAFTIIISAVLFYPLHLPRFRRQEQRAQLENSKFIIHSVSQLSMGPSSETFKVA